MSYTFPSLNQEELVNVLHQYFGNEMDITVEDITKPLKARWKHLFCVILAGMCHTSYEYLSANLLPADELDFVKQDKLEESVQLFNLADCLSCIMQRVGIHVICGRDIFVGGKCDIKHLSLVLSGICNWLRFKDERLAEYQMICREFSLAEQKHYELLQRRDEQNSRIELLKQKHADRDNDIAQVKADIGRQAEELEALKLASDAYQKESSEFQAEIEARKATLVRIREKLAEVCDRVEDAESRIVRSPDRYKAEMDQLEKKDAELCATVKREDVKLANLKSLESSVLYEQSQQVHDQINVWMQLEDKERQQVAEIKVMENKLQTLRNINENKKMDLQNIQYTVDMKLDKQDKFLYQLSMKESYVRNEIQQIDIGMEKHKESLEKMSKLVLEMEAAKENWNREQQGMENELMVYDDCIERLNTERQKNTERANIRLSHFKSVQKDAKKG